MDRKSGLLSNIDFLFNQPTIETYCNNAGNIVCQYVLSKYYENGIGTLGLMSFFKTAANLSFLSYIKVLNLHNTCIKRNKF